MTKPSIVQNYKNLSSVEAAQMLSKRDLVMDFLRIFSVLIVVCVHICMIGIARKPDGSIKVEEPLTDRPWFNIVSWFFQIMPLFFIVGGFASIVAWNSRLRKNSELPFTEQNTISTLAARYVRERILRLIRPAIPFFAFFTLVGWVPRLFRLGEEADQMIDLVLQAVGLPLWFLAAYFICQMATPLMVHFQKRNKWLTITCLLAAVFVVDTSRFFIQAQDPNAEWLMWFGIPNIVFVWLLVQQIGFCYADGWFRNRSKFELVGLIFGSYFLLFFFTTFTPYSPNMLDNLNPPTLMLFFVGVAQISFVSLFYPAFKKLVSFRPLQLVMFSVGSRLMTIYLWHLPMILLTALIALGINLPFPEPGSAAWWLTRPLVFIIAMTFVYLLSLLVGKIETASSIPAPGEVYPSNTVIWTGVILAFIPCSVEVLPWIRFNPWTALFSVILCSIALSMLKPAKKKKYLNDIKI